MAVKITDSMSRIIMRRSMGAVPLDEIGVIAVDEAQELDNRIPGHRMKPAAKPRRLADNFLR